MGPWREFVQTIAGIRDTLRAHDSAIRDALERVTDATRGFQQQMEAMEELWRDPATWFDWIVSATDAQTVALSKRLARAGWWFFPLLHYLPYTELSRLSDAAETDSDDELSRYLATLFRWLMDEEPLVGGESLSEAVEDALLSVDPVGGALRVRYFRQARRAFKLGGMHSLVPPAMLGHTESLVAVASHRGVLGSDPHAYRQLFSRPQKAKRLTETLRHVFTPSAVARMESRVLLPDAFTNQFDVLDTLFGSLVRGTGVGDYASIEDVAVRASGLPSRHYVVHGGLGVDTEAHAARAMSFFIGTTFILRDVQRLGALAESKVVRKQ